VFAGRHRAELLEGAGRVMTDAGDRRPQFGGAGFVIALAAEHGAPATVCLPPAARPETFAGSPRVISDVGNVVDQVKPDVVVTLDPDHGDGHRHHAVIAQATVQACRPPPEVRVYAWALPRLLLARWFAELEKVGPDSAHLELDQRGLGRPERQITTVLDVSDVRSQREHAISLHDSQTSPYDGMSADLRDAFLDTDHLVRLQPAWTGDGREHTLFGMSRRLRSRLSPLGVHRSTPSDGSR
jgi:LmbE family N-acetylglucosaminyl deacetylase